MKRFGFFLLLLLSFTACKKQGDYYYFVDNQSTHALDLTIYEGASSSSKSIGAGTELEVIFKSGRTGMRDKGNGFLTYNAIDSLEFAAVLGGLSVTKDPNVHTNWMYTTNPKRKDGVGKAGDNIYTLVITDTDIQ